MGLYNCGFTVVTVYVRTYVLIFSVYCNKCDGDYNMENNNDVTTTYNNRPFAQLLIDGQDANCVLKLRMIKAEDEHKVELKVCRPSLSRRRADDGYRAEVKTFLTELSIIKILCIK